MFSDNLKKDGINYDNENLQFLYDYLGALRTYKTRGKHPIEYYNIPAAFDIETTSFFECRDDIISTRQWAVLDDKSKAGYIKKAIMYIWQFGIDGFVVYGRTWEGFKAFTDKLSEVMHLDPSRRLMIYVHNISFEFNFIKHRFTWDQIFATKPYMPLYAVSDNGFEFRCSYRNTNKRLEEVGNELLVYQVHKDVGDLDYDLLRNSKTKLTDKELGYCVDDVRVVMAYIQEQIDAEKQVHKIPYTKTGYVRRDCKDNCFKDKDNPKNSKLKRWKYRHFISGLTLTPKIYQSTKDATQGGFTHCNALYSREIMTGVTGLDIASSYPAVMLADLYPMSSPKKRQIQTVEEMEMYCKYYCCIFTIELTDAESTFIYDSYISSSRCHQISGATLDNGRVRAADKLVMTITNVDYWIIKRWYKWSKIRVRDFYTMIKDYLPKPIIESILDYYLGKTQLKGVTGREDEYMRKKANLNSIFGMTLTNIVNPEISLDSDGLWDVAQITPDDLADMIDKYNSSKSRFLYFPWGCFVTAYGRRNIVNAIWQAGEDYIYTDTDSIKLLHYDRHKDFFDRYNTNIAAKIDKCLRYYNLDPELARPTDPKGNKKQMGIFELEGTYKRFKTIGAKRYMYEDNDGIHITVAGLGKKQGTQHLINFGKDPFELFDNDMYVPALETGKLTHTYIEGETSGRITDYQGNIADYHEYSAVHLSPCDFSMSMASDYIKLIQNLKLVNYRPELL